MDHIIKSQLYSGNYKLAIKTNLYACACVRACVCACVHVCVHVCA